MHAFIGAIGVPLQWLKVETMKVESAFTWHDRRTIADRACGMWTDFISAKRDMKHEPNINQPKRANTNSRAFWRVLYSRFKKLLEDCVVYYSIHHLKHSKNINRLLCFRWLDSYSNVIRVTNKLKQQISQRFKNRWPCCTRCVLECVIKTCCCDFDFSLFVTPEICSWNRREIRTYSINFAKKRRNSHEILANLSRTHQEIIAKFGWIDANRILLEFFKLFIFFLLCFFLLLFRNLLLFLFSSFAYARLRLITSSYTRDCYASKSTSLASFVAHRREKLEKQQHNHHGNETRQAEKKQI